VYVLSGNSMASRRRVVRLDIRTSSSVLGPTFPRAADLAFARGAVWVAGGGWSSGRLTGRTVYRLNPTTLRVVNRVDLPSPPLSLAAGAAGLWVGTPRHLYLLDPGSGRVLRTVGADGTIGQVAIDPTGRIMYDATSPKVEGGGAALEERDPVTGTLRIRSTAPYFTYGLGSLAPVPEGVWISFATGNLGAALLERSSDLHKIAVTGSGPGPGSGGTNSIEVHVAGGLLWVSDGMLVSMRCADPINGKRRALVPAIAGNWTSNVVAVDGAVYMGAWKGLLRVRPGPLCRSAA
jgi:hypothetical protein